MKPGRYGSRARAPAAPVALIGTQEVKSCSRWLRWHCATGRERHDEAACVRFRDNQVPVGCGPVKSGVGGERVPQHVRDHACGGVRGGGPVAGGDEVAGCLAQVTSAGQRFQVAGTDQLLDVFGCLEPDRGLRRWVRGGMQAQLAGEEAGEDRSQLQETRNSGGPGPVAGRRGGSLAGLARLDVYVIREFYRTGGRKLAGERSRRTDPGEQNRRLIVRFVREFTDREGHPPSLREIGGRVGLAISTVSYHVSILEQDGTLRRGAGQPRTIAPLAGPAGRPEADTVDVPLIGQIPAGVPVDAMELGEDTFQLPRRLVGSGTLFMLKVTGDSMTGAAIVDGDLVVVRQQPVAENGDIVAAQLDGTGTAEATVKSLQRINGHAWLIPHHPGYQPLLADDAVILGKAVAVIRPTGLAGRSGPGQR